MTTWKSSAHQICPHGLTVYLVNGTFVRSQIYEEEWPFIIYHECTEVELMRKGMSYDRAHDRAKRLEDKLRHEGLRPEGLRPEGLRPETQQQRHKMSKTKGRHVRAGNQIDNEELLAMMNIIQKGADYISHPDIEAVGSHFSLPSSNIVRGLREVVARLKTLL